MAPENEPYHLVYWVGFPGRGEYIRVVLEDAGVEYTDTAHQEPGSDEVKAYYSGRVDGSNLPAYAPPVLRHGNLTISQTPNILLYLGKQLGYVPDGEENMFRVNALAMTILDGLSNEVYAVHHPLAAMGDYADRKAEAKKVADLYAKQRLPRFLNYFERVLSSQASGEGPWLFGGRLTYADIILFHCLDGLKFQFPKAMTKYEGSGKYAKVFALYNVVKERPKLSAYLSSPKFQKFGAGIYQYHEELDIEPEEA